MERCFVALGANLGNPQKNIKRAFAEISKLDRISNFKRSKIYLTSPVSDITQPDYLNAVCVFETPLAIKKLWLCLNEIEAKLGKMPLNLERNGPRLIDLDLLFYGEKVNFQKDLIVPHPRWHERRFVLEPLKDLESSHPLPFEICVKKLLENFRDPNNETVLCIGDTL
jgi:2-amino-4-hydroxy-6-hydroxymethyldihydropteridine diphosphokinase